MKKISLVAPCLFGIEKIAADEFRQMGFEDIITENGRVLIKGEPNMLARANICSRFAERILINVGEFIKPQIKKHKNTIEKLLIKKKQNFEKAYETLRAISHLINIENITNFKVNNLNLKEKFSLIPQKHCGSERKLFCSFITKNGIENFYYKNKFKNIEVLPFNFFENALLLENLSKMLKENNFNFISFMSPLNPTLREAIYIEETKTIIYAFNINENLLESFKNKTIIQKLLKQAGSYIERAKYYHKKIEVYYVKNMDFNGLKKHINNIEKKLKIKKNK